MTDRGTLTLGVTAILIASIFAGSATFAYFSDTETSTGNTFTAGTLDVKIKDGGQEYGDDMGPVWYLTDIKPGYSDVLGHSFDFKNYGSIAIDHMEITCSYTVTESTEEPDNHDTSSDPDAMAAEFTIKSLWVYKGLDTPVDLLPQVDKNYNGNNRPDLEDLKHQGVPVSTTIVPDPNQGTHITVDMMLEFDSGAGNDFQGDTLVLTIIFTFNQHPSQ